MSAQRQPNEFGIEIRVAIRRGMLARVALALGKRGYTINAMTITDIDDRQKKMALIIQGDPKQLYSALHQIERLVDVIEVKQVESVELDDRVIR